MICPQCCGFDRLFNEKHAARELKRYRRKGPIRSTRLLIDALVAEGVDRATILDIGAGIGAVLHELLRAGAAGAVDVEGATAYVEAAREEAERQGHADRVQFHHGDFVDMAEGVEPADIVTLDRVVCCYPDMPTLVGKSVTRARRLYGLVYPRPRLLLKAARPVVNLIFRLRRCPLRFHLHPPARIDEVVRQAGFASRSRHTTLLWEVAVYARSADAAPG